jgi:hypothetical protein
MCQHQFVASFPSADLDDLRSVSSSKSSRERLLSHASSISTVTSILSPRGGDIFTSSQASPEELPDRLERVVILVIDYLGMDALVSLGAMYLDDSITADLASALRQFMSSRDVKRKMHKPRTAGSGASSRQVKTGVSLLKHVDADSAAASSNFAQLVTSGDIQSSRVSGPSVDSMGSTKGPSASGSGTRRMSSGPVMDIDASGSSKPAGPVSKGKLMKSVLGQGGAVPKKSAGPSLALIATGGGTVAPTFDRKSSVFASNNSRASNASSKSGSFKPSRSSGKSLNLSQRSISIGDRSVDRSAGLQMNSGILTDTSSSYGVLMQPVESASSTLSSLDNDTSLGDLIPAPPVAAKTPTPRMTLSRGRLRATVSSLEGGDDSSVASLDSGK